MDTTDTRTFFFEGTITDPSHSDFGDMPAFTSATGIENARTAINSVFTDLDEQWRQVLSLAGLYGVVFNRDDVTATLGDIVNRMPVDATITVETDAQSVAITRTA
ncbi:hypothetical protein [Dietzia sp. 179-F 9C3 NHS]|uniref:hypothetical protein n=1 Tax=Dietzia sp. 179-F 9C3 NHS TaxID=3374295 RepID=UPI003879E35C